MVAIVERAITIWEAIQKRSHEPTYKTHTKIEAISKWEAIQKNPLLL